MKWLLLIIKMAVPSRKNRMMQNIIQNQEKDKEKLKSKTDEEKISEEEHKKRLEKLREMGLIKK